MVEFAQRALGAGAAIHHVVAVIAGVFNKMLLWSPSAPRHDPRLCAWGIMGHAQEPCLPGLERLIWFFTGGLERGIVAKMGVRAFKRCS